MAKFTYNILTQEVSWDCPDCSHINSFPVSHRPITLICEGCGFSFQIDPIRYEQFEAMDDAVDEVLLRLLGSEKIED